MGNKGIENLRPGAYKFTREDHAKGGRASAEKKAMRREIQSILQMTLQTGKIADDSKFKALSEYLDENGEPKNVRAQTMLAFRLVMDALNGDHYAMDKILAVADVLTPAPEEKKADNNLLEVLADSIETVTTDEIPEIQ